MKKYTIDLPKFVYNSKNIPQILNSMEIREYDDHIMIITTTKSLVTYLIKLAKTYKAPTKESEITMKLKYDEHKFRLIETDDLNYVLDLLDQMIRIETVPDIHDVDGFKVMLRRTVPGGWVPTLKSMLLGYSRIDDSYSYPEWDVTCYGTRKDNDIVQSLICHMSLLANGVNVRYSRAITRKFSISDDDRIAMKANIVPFYFEFIRHLDELNMELSSDVLHRLIFKIDSMLTTNVKKYDTDSDMYF